MEHNLGVESVRDALACKYRDRNITRTSTTNTTIQGDHIIGRHTILLCSSVFVEITNVMMVNNGQSIHRRNLMIKIKPSFPEILMN